MEPQEIHPLATVHQLVPNSTPPGPPPILCSHCGSDRFVKRRKDYKGDQIYRCKRCGRHFVYNPNRRHESVVDPEGEYKKDVWDCRNLGVSAGVGKYQYKLSFKKIAQSWLLPPAKLFIKLSLSTLSFSTASARLLAIQRFSEFLAQFYPDTTPPEITREVMIDFLVRLSSENLSASSRCATIGSLRTFLEMSYQNQWLDVRRYLVRPEDYPQRPKAQPRYVPEEVMQQLNQHLSDLPEPVMRMVLILQECGMRISELLLLRFDCLLQDKAGDWFLRYYQFKMKKEITIPVSREIVFVVQEQQRYIRENLGTEFAYLFCANESVGRKGVFHPSLKTMTRNTFAAYLNKLAERHNICDVTGMRWHFQPHQFRHTVGTRMINNGVPQHIIQRYLGHESPLMTSVYAHIHDQTLKTEIAKFQGKVVNIAGQVVESVTPEVDIPDMQWFKRSVQAQALPNGSCALPAISQGCPHANACLTCGHFRTTAEHLVEHKKQLRQTEQIIEKAQANGWTRQVEMNERVASNLKSIISTLEAVGND